ncbi:hypothetical protein ABW20_dc0102277 [Dactylellina cionopaga]|nr:hypothetical protein ABW20_dc0102277 [Dactylellina cionopaga]
MGAEVDVDLFDAVLNLEEDYYTQGHREGFLAGATAGRLEGRAFGIEKGFEKYLALGTIKGRTKVWQARTVSLPVDTAATAATGNVDSTDKDKDTLSSLKDDIKISNPRYLKHISLLQTLTTTPPICNEEDDVEEVDDRIRRGKAKVKILENALRESSSLPSDEDDDLSKVKMKGNIGGRASVVGGVRVGMETEVEDFKIRRG